MLLHRDNHLLRKGQYLDCLVFSEFFIFRRMYPPFKRLFVENHFPSLNIILLYRNFKVLAKKIKPQMTQMTQIFICEISEICGCFSLINAPKKRRIFDWRSYVLILRNRFIKFSWKNRVLEPTKFLGSLDS
jgi:hypothetical protein